MGAGAVGSQITQVLVQPDALRSVAALDNLHAVAIAQRLVQRRRQVIDQRHTTLVTHFRVNHIGEIERRGPLWQLLNITGGRIDHNLVAE